jgi:hypothetical protein
MAIPWPATPLRPLSAPRNGIWASVPEHSNREMVSPPSQLDEVPNPDERPALMSISSAHPGEQHFVKYVIGPIW